MTEQERKIAEHYRVFAMWRAKVDAAFKDAQRRIDAVKAEEQQKIMLVISRAKLEVEASAARNLPPGYLRNNSNRISDWNGFTK